MRARTNRAFIAVALLLAILLCAYAWWLHGHGAGDDSQRQRLAAAVERQQQLSAQLAQAPDAGASSCPPGQTLTPMNTGTPAAPAETPASSVASGSVDADKLPSLAQRLERATAIVIVPADGGYGLGTGFFVTPNLLVTNRHVVEQGKSAQLILASKALGSVRRGTVLQVTRSSTPGSPDFALIRLEDGSSPGTLDIGGPINKLAGVVAAGYPGVVIEGDANFKRLMGGDMTRAPDLNMTTGTVQSLQGEDGTPVIIHTASINKGNSGGPLVDLCGRVVGVNTFIGVDQSQSSKINYALQAQSLSAFLKSAGAAAHADLRSCRS